MHVLVFRSVHLGLIGEVDTTSEDSIDPYDSMPSARKHKTPLNKILGNGHAYSTLKTEDDSREKMLPSTSSVNSDDEEIVDTIYSRAKDKVLFDRYGPDFRMMGSSDSLTTVPGDRSLDGSRAAEEHDET